MKEKKLNPCPHCGGDADFVYDLTHDCFVGVCVMCRECGARSGAVQIGETGHMFQPEENFIPDAEEQEIAAIAARVLWNRRPWQYKRQIAAQNAPESP